MNKTMKRIISMVLTLMLVAGLVPLAAASTSKAITPDDYRVLKIGGKGLTTNITKSVISESFRFTLAKPAKVTFKVSTDLSTGANFAIKKGREFTQIDGIVKVQNGENKSILKYLSAGEYFVTVAREGVDETGKIQVSAKATTLDTTNDKEVNDAYADATDFSELKAATFKGYFLFDDRKDCYKITVQEMKTLNVKVKALTDNGGKLTVQIGKLDDSGDLVNPWTKVCTKGSEASDLAFFSQTVMPGTYYIVISSDRGEGEYEFSSTNITPPIQKIVAKKNVTVKVGKKVNLIKSIKPAGAEGVINISIADDSKAELLSVKKGTIKGLKIGKTKVTIKYGDKTIRCNVTVKK